LTDAALSALVTTAVATGLFHTLIPDHWLPFVLIGRVRGWSAGRTALVSGFSALVHVGLSILIALLALRLGFAAADAVGRTLEWVGGLLLIAFGVGYAGWAWHKGGHFHPGGALLHGGTGRGGCHGEEGPGNPQHLHYHADDGLIRDRSGWSGWVLALVIGANPCVLLIPLALVAQTRASSALVWVVLAYALPTVLLMVGLSVLGVVWGKRVRLPGAARHMEAASGLLIAALGVALWLFEGSGW
jgi:hypothetical protein